MGCGCKKKTPKTGVKKPSKPTTTPTKPKTSSK